MADLPDPLVPPEIDIRGLAGFMLDVNRLLASELVALGTPEECWHAVMLWCRAWQQHPAASLPNDERVLAAFSKAGGRWKSVREMALRGFVLCNDGRLYHQVLSEQVRNAWAKRQAYRNDQERLKKWRANKKGNPTPNGADTHSETPPETDDETRFKTGRQGQDRDKEESKQAARARAETQDETQSETRFKTGSDANGHGPPRWDDAAIVPEPNDHRPLVNGSYLDGTYADALDAARIDQTKSPVNWKPVVGWLRDGYEPEQIVDAIRRCAQRSSYRPPQSLAYFDKAVRELSPAWKPMGGVA